MKRILYFFFTVLLSTAIKAQTSTKIDTTQFVAFYNYSINTLDEKGKCVIDSLRLALLVGNRATCCTTLQTYNKDGRASQEMLNAFIMHHQNVTTDLEKNEVIAVEPIYPYRYESHEPLAQVDWKLTEDTMTICSLPCRQAIGKLYGKQWTVWYSEEIPSSAGPWKLQGLPGLIVKAEDSQGIHRFELYETKNEVRNINLVNNPNYKILDRKKLNKFKKKTFGNSRYVNDPTYYVPDNADYVGEVNMNGINYHIGMNSHMLILQKGHIYQPLELE